MVASPHSAGFELTTHKLPTNKKRYPPTSHPLATHQALVSPRFRLERTNHPNHPLASHSPATHQPLTSHSPATRHQKRGLWLFLFSRRSSGGPVAADRAAGGVAAARRGPVGCGPVGRMGISWAGGGRQNRFGSSHFGGFSVNSPPV